MNILLDILTQFYGVDILAMILTFGGLYLVGNEKRIGFIVALLGNITWALLGIFVASFGLVFANLVIVILYIRGYIKWGQNA